MSLNKIKINQLDFDVGEISLAANSGFFITSDQLVSVSGSLKNDLNNTGIYFNSLSGQVSQFSGDFNNFSSRSFVYGTGDQTITGIKTFRSQPNFQGTGFVYKNETGNFIVSTDLRFLPDLFLLFVTGAGTSSVNGLYYNTFVQVNSKDEWRGILSNGLADNTKRIVWQPALGWCIETFFSPGGWLARYRQLEPSASSFLPNTPTEVGKFVAGGSIYEGNQPAPTIYFGYNNYYNSINKDIQYFKFISGSNNSLSIGFVGSGWSSSSFLASNKKVNFRGIDGTAALLEDNIVFRTGDQTLSGIKDFTNRPTFSGARILVSGDNDIVYTTGNQNIGGLKNFTGERIQISGSGILHSGEVALRVHTHPISGIINLENELSGKLSNIQLPNKTVIANSTPIVFDSYRNAILDYEINHGGISTIYLPRTGVAGAPRNGDQIIIQVSTNLPSVSPTKIQTGIGGAGTPSYGDFYTFDNGVGGVSLFYTNDRWNLRSILTAHSQTHAIGGNDRIFPLNIGAAPRQDFAAFEWTSNYSNLVLATGNLNVDGVRYNSFPVNYIPWNLTGYNTNTGVFSLVNPGTTGARIKISASGIYEMSLVTHFYDASGNCDFLANLNRSFVSTGSMSAFAMLIDERYGETKTDRMTNSRYSFIKTNALDEYYNATIISNCRNPAGTAGIYPSDDGTPTRIEFKKLM